MGIRIVHNNNKTKWYLLTVTVFDPYAFFACAKLYVKIRCMTITHRNCQDKSATFNKVLTKDYSRYWSTLLCPLLNIEMPIEINFLWRHWTTIYACSSLTSLISIRHFVQLRSAIDAFRNLEFLFTKEKTSYVILHGLKWQAKLECRKSTTYNTRHRI